MSKMDVTLIDAFKIKEINLLLGSYIFSMCHNLFILKADLYTGQSINHASISEDLGSIFGVMLSGILVDIWFKKRRFLTILVLNILVLFFDVYLFCTKQENYSQRSNLFMFILGAILTSSNLVYLILIPMLIAKQHAEEMALNNAFQRVCYAGTIAGAVLAMCQVGRYLVSDNLATLLQFWIRDYTHQAVWTDIITFILLSISTLILLGPIRSEFRETSLYHRLCVRRGDDEEENDDPVAQQYINRTQSKG